MFRYLQVPSACRRLVRLDDEPVPALTKDPGISESCLHNVMAQADADDNGSTTRLTSAEKKQCAELRS